MPGEIAYDNARLQQAARDHLWMHFTRHSTLRLRPSSRSSSAARVPTSTTSTGKRYLDGLAGLFVSQLGHGRTELAEAAAKQTEQLAFMPLWSYAHPNAIELAERVADYAPGDLNRVFFTTGGGEAVETAWKLAKNYFKLTGKPYKHKVISRAIAYHGTPQGALSITGLPGMKAPFEPLVPSTFRVPNTNYYRAPYFEDDEKKFGLWAANEIAVAIENEGPDTVAAVFLEPVQNSGGCFPPPPGYFERGPRDLRRVRRAAGQRRGDLRVRPARPHVRRRALRLPARHDHLRQGHHLRLRPARRDDRHRPADGAVPARAPRRSSTATRSAATRSRPRSRWPTSTSSRRRSINEHVRENEGALPRDAREAQGPADRRRRTRRRLLLRHRAGQGQGHQGDLQRRGVARSCCAGSCPRRCTTPASTAVPTTAATRSSSSLPR